jgi:hypothetical protein
MGGGVAIGDINNDGLPDIFFTGNMVKNKLYLNKGNFKFEDISLSAGIEGDDRWYTGATMVDINSDGWLDIYVCVSGTKKTENQLYINNGDSTFKERAEDYNLNDKSPSIHSVFFDYDKDGYLDLFVGNYPVIPLSLPNAYYFNQMKRNAPELSGHLYRNTGNGSYVNVTEDSGVMNFGLTLGVSVSDFNNDGWQDLYVSNDFQVPDYFYLNNGDGTFTNKLSTSFQHTSMFGMGIDASDINNDGLADLIQLDMAPADYFRAKTNMASMNPKSFWEIVDLGGHYQYMQNSLQINNGANTDGVPIFSEVSRLAGVATTDWSWGVLFADFNNDTKKDIFITNGIRRDVNYNDIIKASKSPFRSDKIDIRELPSEPLHNYLFQNLGEYEFSDVSIPSGFNVKRFSNGVSYGDLDNDGDLDLVINNLDDVAQVYENKTENDNNFLKIKFLGPKDNLFGIGTKVELICENGIYQMQELSVSKGFQSAVDPSLLFGLGMAKKVKEIHVQWPDGHTQKFSDIRANQTFLMEYNDNEPKTTIYEEEKDKTTYVFNDITVKSGIDFKHQEDPYNDFINEPLLPHKYSSLGPGIAVGDINNDGRDDFFIGNAKNSKAALYVQTEHLKFIRKSGPWDADFIYEDTGAIFFDPDQDGDMDLLVVSGGNDIETDGDKIYQDRIYINIDGEFIKCDTCLPELTNSGQTVAQADYDSDGDIDLFVGGRIVPGKYPLPSASYILENDGGKDGMLRFTNVTEQLAPDFLNLGLVTSAIWKDFNQDGIPDLVLAGEWMPIRFYEFVNGRLIDKTRDLGLNNTKGWWYSLKEMDFDGDGDLDLFAGNLGLNYKYKTNKQAPFQVYYSDFDENGNSDIVLSYIKNDKQLPLRGKECSGQQIPSINVRFKTYESFAKATLPEIYGEGMLADALMYETDTFAHSWLENRGKEGFLIHQLPRESQFSSINAIEIINVNNDNLPDLIMGGNLYNAEVETPRNDSSFGLILKNNADKTFESLEPKKTGLFMVGEIRNIRKIKLGNNKDKEYFLMAVNNDSLKLIEMTK